MIRSSRPSVTTANVHWFFRSSRREKTRVAGSLQPSHALPTVSFRRIRTLKRKTCEFGGRIAVVSARRRHIRNAAVEDRGTGGDVHCRVASVTQGFEHAEKEWSGTSDGASAGTLHGKNGSSDHHGGAKRVSKWNSTNASAASNSTESGPVLRDATNRS